MKKTKSILLILSIFLILGCTKKENTVTNTPSDAQTEPTVASEATTNDPLLSTYSEGPGDGYSWKRRTNNYDSSTTILTKEKLLSTKWLMDPNINQYCLMIFYKDDVFKIGTFQAGESITGKYEIKDSKLILTAYNNDDKNCSGISLKGDKIICDFNPNSNNVVYKHELKVQDYTFFPAGCYKVTGDSAIINGIEVVIDKRTVVFNDSVRFRTEPNLNSDLIPVYLYSEMTNEPVPNPTSFKKGTIVNILAATTYTETIDSLTAPWNYIIIYDGFEGSQYGWVFGAYFDEFDESKESEYWETLRKHLK